MSAVDQAVIAKLQNAMTATAPGGVYWDVAPHGIAEPFVIVGLQAHEDVDEMGGDGHEVGRYLVKAVGQGTQAAAVGAAATAIHAALQDQPLTITGYAHMVTTREERIRFTEVDGTVRWVHRGGIYQVWAAAS